MHAFVSGLGFLIAAVWVSRLVEWAIYLPRVADLSASQWETRLEAEPRVTVVVPARNEEEGIGECLRSLARLEYGNFEVIAVNDRSTDGTGQIMQKVAGEHPGIVRIIHVHELPEGWLGKTHAMWKAADQSSGDWVLFTDGDVIFKPDSLRRAIRYAQYSSADHLVLLPAIVMESFGERMMIASLQMMFLLSVRPWKISDPNAWDHAGVGAFNMVRRSSYEAIGTYESMRLAVVDDLKLGRVIKQHGFAQRMAFGDDLIKLRWAKGAMGVANNMTKNAFAILGFRIWLVLVAGTVVATLNIGPFVGSLLAPGWSRASYLVALLTMFIASLKISRKSKVSPVFFLLHPVGSALISYAMLRSMVLALVHGGITWRGTKYPLDPLRRAAR